MLNVFVKKSGLEELHIQLSDGRIMPLKDLVRDYERLLKEEGLKKVTTSRPKADKSTVSKLKVGEWFRIDREVINKSKEKIRRKCYEAGSEGKKLWKRFEASNKIADENPYQFPRLIETYIFEHTWDYKTEQEMRDMCEELGDGMCCEVICDLELQMRICNGELVDDLVKKNDKLPRVRVIKLRDGRTGFFGGGADNADNYPPACLYTYFHDCFKENYDCTPYAFRFPLA